MREGDLVGTKLGLSGDQVEVLRTCVAEAIVNAVAHRDYTSTGSVQVMLFADQPRVLEPGRAPPVPLEKLRQAHGSVPKNPLLAEPTYLAGYVERMGTGTRGMIRHCTEAGLPEPEFAGSVRVPDDRPPDSGSRPGATARVEARVT